MSAALTCAALIAIAGCAQDPKPIHAGWVTGLEFVPAWDEEVTIMPSGEKHLQHHDDCWEVVITDYHQINYLCTTKPEWQRLKKGDWFK